MLLKNIFPHFWENVGKIAVMKVLENYQKNVFHSVAFRKFELSDPPNYNYAENYVCSEKLQNCWGSVCGGASIKVFSYIFQGMSEKLQVWKFWKIIRKTSLVAFLLRNLSCLIYPPITISKTDSTANASFVSLFQELWKLMWKRLWWNHF